MADYEMNVTGITVKEKPIPKGSTRTPAKPAKKPTKPKVTTTVVKSQLFLTEPPKKDRYGYYASRSVNISLEDLVTKVVELEKEHDAKAIVKVTDYGIEIKVPHNKQFAQKIAEYEQSLLAYEKLELAKLKSIVEEKEKKLKG